MSLKESSKSRKRTEIFNDLVNDVEEEIAKIAQQISDKRIERLKIK